jgi:Zn-dependent protease with chaperone function
MSGRARIAALITLLAAGGALVAALVLRRVGTPLESSLAPAFELLGSPVKSLDRFVGRVVPVDALDERDLGRALRARYGSLETPNDPDHLYLNDLMAHISTRSRKPFDYQVSVLSSPAPNAMALPGGGILVTSGLLATLQSESELVAVLAHELGHIELSHCLDAVKFELLARKLGTAPLGQIADLAVRILVAHSFSKAQEAEADEYAYALLLHSRYEPRGAGRAFASLLAWEERRDAGRGPSHADPFRDYFSSHPPLELRRDEFLARAGAWWRGHQEERRYVGEANLGQRRSFFSGLRPSSEWTDGRPGTRLANPPPLPHSP